MGGGAGTEARGCGWEAGAGGAGAARKNAASRKNPNPNSNPNPNPCPNRNHNLTLTLDLALTLTLTLTIIATHVTSAVERMAPAWSSLHVPCAASERMGPSDCWSNGSSKAQIPRAAGSCGQEDHRIQRWKGCCQRDHRIHRWSGCRHKCIRTLDLLPKAARGRGGAQSHVRVHPNPWLGG